MSISNEQIADIFMRQRIALTGLAWALVRDRHLAEDAVQEALVGAFRKSETFQSADHVRLWLRQAVRLRAIDLYRKRSRQAVLFNTELTEQLVETWESLGTANSSDMIEALENCLRRLSPRDSELIKMRYRESADSAEIADRLGYKLQTVYSTLSRVRRSLADCIWRRLEGAR